VIRPLYRRLRPRVTYATVAAAISAFILLAGGAAFAASHLGRHSVGTKQLKKNAVTTAKIKKGAVTTAKIRDGAVSAAEVPAGSIGRAAFELESTPYTHVVQEAKSTAAFALSEDLAPVPLSGSAYTQPVGRDDFFFGTATTSFSASCEGPNREVDVRAYVDLRHPDRLMSEESVASGFVQYDGQVPATLTIPLRPEAALFQPAATAARTITILASAECENEPPSATLESVTLDLAGTR
jgi:hypothetical protein